MTSDSTTVLAHHAPIKQPNDQIFTTNLTDLTNSFGGRVRARDGRAGTVEFVKFVGFVVDSSAKPDWL
jgi:hypothetical protein